MSGIPFKRGDVVLAQRQGLCVVLGTTLTHVLLAPIEGQEAAGEALPWQLRRIVPDRVDAKHAAAARTALEREALLTDPEAALRARAAYNEARRAVEEHAELGETLNARLHAAWKALTATGGKP